MGKMRLREVREEVGDPDSEGLWSHFRVCVRNHCATLTMENQAPDVRNNSPRSYSWLVTEAEPELIATDPSSLLFPICFTMFMSIYITDMNCTRPSPISPQKHRRSFADGWASSPFLGGECVRWRMGTVGPWSLTSWPKKYENCYCWPTGKSQGARIGQRVRIWAFHQPPLW